MAAKKERDIERTYPVRQMVSTLRRLARCLEKGKSFRIQVAGERITVPAGTAFSVEHEREGDAEELEFQFRWKRS